MNVDEVQDLYMPAMVRFRRTCPVPTLPVEVAYFWRIYAEDLADITVDDANAAMNWWRLNRQYWPEPHDIRAWVAEHRGLSSKAHEVYDELMAHIDHLATMHKNPGMFSYPENVPADIERIKDRFDNEAQFGWFVIWKNRQDPFFRRELREICEHVAAKRNAAVQEPGGIQKAISNVTPIRPELESGQ